MNSDIEAAALAELRAHGLELDSVQWDMGIVRCATTGKPHGKDGAYSAHSDNPACIWWQNYPSGTDGVWTVKGLDKLSAAEQEALARRMDETRKAREAEQSRVHAEAAEQAQAIYAAAKDCTEHAYLSNKGVKPVPGLKVGTDSYGNEKALLIPLYNEAGETVSLQSIPATPGEGGKYAKLFLKGGRKKGCFFSVGGKSIEKPLLIAEGLATGLSLYECLSLPVLVAFDAGNLLPVAELARRKYPDRQIVLCGDCDSPSNQVPQAGGVGFAKARAAALAVGGFVATPRLSGRKVDWNDLHQKMGIAEVALQFQTCHKPEPPKPKTDTLPEGFVLRSAGLFHIEQKEDAAPVETWLGPPLHVLGATRDEHGNAWGLLLEWHDPDGGRHTWAMPKALLVGRDNSAWLGRLADEGWSGAPGTNARKLLSQYLATYRTELRALCVPCTGWHRGVFVFPDKVIKNMSDVSDVSDGLTVTTSSDVRQEKSMSDVSDVERIVLQTTTAHNPFRMAGTLDGWKTSIGQWARGNSRLMLAICASLAAPLLELAGQESGGFNWTGQSSTGKTTALVAAGSAWGKGTSSGGYVQNWRATANGLEGLAALHSDAALCLDEIGQAPVRTIQEAAYMLANGMGKSRAYQDGSAKAVKSWRCMVLSTGEKGLAEKITEQGGTVQAGQTVRLIDVPSDAGAGMGIFENLHGHESPQAFADAIKQAAAAHYGHAARAFIGSIQEHRETAVAELQGFLNGGLPLLCDDDASGQVQRVARRFLLCAAAGEMAAEWGLLSWEKGEALQSVKICFEAWLALRGGAGAAEDTALLEQVMLFIEQHGQSRFQDIEKPEAVCINRVGFRREVENGTEFLVLPESFRAEVCKGHNAKRAAAVLLSKKLLVPGENRNFARYSPVALPGYGRRKRCYTILINGGGQDVVE